MKNLVVGDTYVYRFECRIKNSNELFDPSLLKVSLILGNGAEDTVTYGASPESLKQFSRISQGIYELRYVLPVPGAYRVRVAGNWDAGGVSWPVIARHESIFDVDPISQTFNDAPAIP
jgi:hypothetical protein